MRDFTDEENRPGGDVSRELIGDEAPTCLSLSQGHGSGMLRRPRFIRINLTSFGALLASGECARARVTGKQTLVLSFLQRGAAACRGADGGFIRLIDSLDLSAGGVRRRLAS